MLVTSIIPEAHTEAYLQAFLEQAGFAYPLNLKDTITGGAFATFQTRMRSVFDVLRVVGPLWIATKPTFVTGFECGREQAAARLANAPVGAFLCRVSLTAPGHLSFSCKVRRATEQQLLHGCIARGSSHALNKHIVCTQCACTCH